MAKAVAAAMTKSLRPAFHRSCHPARSSSDHAMSMSRPAMAAFGIYASSGALSAISNRSSSAENTAASGVRAPASRFGIDLFSEPQDT